MKSIAFDEENGKQISARIQEFFKRYQLSEILRKSNAYKQQGVSVMAIMSYLLPGISQSQHVSGHAIRQSSGLQKRHRIPSQKCHAHQLDALYNAALRQDHWNNGGAFDQRKTQERFCH